MRYCLILILLIFYACNNEDSKPKPVANNVDTDFFKDGEVETIFENNRDSGVNIVLLADGYTKRDLGKKFGNYPKDAKKFIDALFNTPPFAAYQKDFNMYVVYAESAKSKISIGNPSQDNTAFGITIYNGQYIYNRLKVEEYARKAIPNAREVHLRLMLTNYGLNGRAFYGVIAIFDTTSEITMLHEVGHAFGFLGEEYSNNWETSIGHPNIDSTNKLSMIKWSHFIGLPSYKIVGAYPGSNNLWIPEPYSIMGNDERGVAYNAPSREAIVKRIIKIKGAKYDFNVFLKKDVPN